MAGTLAEQRRQKPQNCVRSERGNRCLYSAKRPVPGPAAQRHLPGSSCRDDPLYPRMPPVCTPDVPMPLLEAEADRGHIGCIGSADEEPKRPP
jgi:hypothetical protein